MIRLGITEMQMQKMSVAELLNAINQNTAQAAAQQEKSNNMVKNILLVLGGSLGLILAYGLAKKALK